MDNIKENYIRNGVFLVCPEQELNGTLSLNGEDSVLHLWTNYPVNIDSDSLDGKTITGVLDNQKKASLIDCIVIQEQHLHGKGGVSQHYKLFPHFVVLGHRHYSKSEKAISRASFVIDDAMALFHDRTSFGTVRIPPDRTDELASLDIFGKMPFEGNSPVLAYWTGKEEIFSADTIIGKISACNRPTIAVGGHPSGASIKNEIVVNIEFSNSLNVREMDVEIRKVLRLFHSVLGRPQNLLELKITETETSCPESSAVYLNMYPNYPRGTGIREPDFRDILINAAVDPDGFSQLLSAWLKKEQMRGTARISFTTGWARGRSYDADRMVRAANMFDLLPSEALPPDTVFQDSLDAAIQKSRKIFKELPQSTKRGEILGYLGRLKKPSLKEKIRYRSSLISNLIGSGMPNIDAVTDAAVDLRNIYVHGGILANSRITRLQEFMFFLTDTLEFVFCTSDLFESGWDIETWHAKPKGAGHPFADYLRSYSENLARFMM